MQRGPEVGPKTNLYPVDAGSFTFSPQAEAWGLPAPPRHNPLPGWQGKEKRAFVDRLVMCR